MTFYEAMRYEAFDYSDRYYPEMLNDMGAIEEWFDVYCMGSEI